MVLFRNLSFIHLLKKISKVYRMAELTTISTEVDKVIDKTAVKRPLTPGEEENIDSNVPDVKKSKTEGEVPPPMQGRLDKKRKVALLLAYCGAGYYGIQVQKDYPTIESELLSSLVKGNFITQEDADVPQKIQFQRAARTDKGVSATCNVISLKMSLHSDKVLEELNKSLPEQIRVICYLRVTRGFNSKNFCDSRTYKYMLPTYALAGVETFITDEYRIDDASINRLQEVLNMYKGTHNFHNFTSGIKPTEACAKRYIISFETEKPIVQDGMEFLTVTVKGQSFMLHHIRKMVALAICIVRGVCGVDAVTRSFTHDKMDVPKAPSEGLYLYQTHYNGYNRRYGADGMHDPIDWSHCQAELEEFTKKYVTSHIVQSEKNNRVVLQWLKVLQLHKFDTREDNEHRSIQVAETLKVFKAQGVKPENSNNESVKSLEVPVHAPSINLENSNDENDKKTEINTSESQDENQQDNSNSTLTSVTSGNNETSTCVLDSESKS